MFPFAKFGYQSTHFADKVLFKRYGTIRRFLTINFCHQTTNKQIRKRRFSVDNLVIGVQLADVSTRCSSHLQGKGEVRCENAEAL